jgi:CheY-like chemotaxis protein
MAKIKNEDQEGQQVISVSKIGIIDDNFDQRETLRLSLGVYLENNDSTFEVIDIFPFVTETFQEYFQWIKDENIVCLIFDERMNNETENGVGPVGYRGDQLVSIIRERFKDIPIYVITSNKGDDELTAKFSEFEDIIERQEFIDEGDKYVDRIIRATQRYLDENKKELQTFQKLSEKVASGEYSDEEYDNLLALQTKLHLPLDVTLNDRQEWLDQYEKTILELEKLKTELQSKLNQN